MFTVQFHAVGDLLMDNTSDILPPLFNDAITNVAVDNGYADQKIAYWAEGENGEKKIEVHSYPSRAQMGAINISIDGKSAGVYDVEGDAWTVGKDVTDPETIRSEKYAFSELNAVLVKHSLIASGFSGKNVRIATGLPFEHMYKDGRPDQELVDKVKDSISVDVIPRGDAKAASISSHVVYPESTAAFVDFAVDEQTGEMSKSIEVGAAVVDIGGNTTDITYINSNNTINVDRSGSKHVGVLNIRDRLKKLIQERFKVQEVRDVQLDKALRTGACSIFGKEEDVSEQIDRAKRQTLKKLMNWVEEMVGDAGDLDFILFVGGGAAVLEDLIKEYPHAQVPKDPQFSNARGMLKYMTFVDLGKQ